MRFIANIIWIIFGGLVLGAIWALLGLVLCITVIGIPFGIQCFKVAKLVFAPFGKKVYTNFDKHPVANILWGFLCGWELAIGHLISGLLCCMTIIAIPLGIQSFKMMKLAFLPFGASVNNPRK
jgi:uncharacterized membrane protein YccF (DUF307 family)